MELYKSKLSFDSIKLLDEINLYYDTSSVSNDNVKMESYNTDLSKFSKLNLYKYV